GKETAGTHSRRDVFPSPVGRYAMTGGRKTGVACKTMACCWMFPLDFFRWIFPLAYRWLAVVGMLLVLLVVFRCFVIGLPSLVMPLSYGWILPLEHVRCLRAVGLPLTCRWLILLPCRCRWLVIFLPLPSSVNTGDGIISPPSGKNQGFPVYPKYGGIFYQGAIFPKFRERQFFCERPFFFANGAWTCERERTCNASACIPLINELITALLFR
ncbi:unnamed protein product, partial [Laminaria digitata]